MRNTPFFRWKCSFMGGIEYEVFDETGRYLVEIRDRSPGAYELSIANGDHVRSEWKSSVGILRCFSSANNFEARPEIVDAFNEWRMEQHLDFIRQIESQPDRYGFLAPDDPLRNPPPLARGGRYVMGEHRWEVTHALA
jgi:hypothetical protein